MSKRPDPGAERRLASRERLVEARRSDGDTKAARAQVRRLQDQKRRLEARGAELLGAEVAADAGWVPAQMQARIDDLGEERDRALAEVRRADEELEQARRLNRELMAEANKARPKR